MSVSIVKESKQASSEVKAELEKIKKDSIKEFLKTEVSRQIKVLVGEIAKADGFLLTVTCLNGDKLNHHHIMQNFKNDDITKSIVSQIDTIKDRD